MTFWYLTPQIGKKIDRKSNFCWLGGIFFRAKKNLWQHFRYTQKVPRIIIKSLSAIIIVKNTRFAKWLTESPLEKSFSKKNQVLILQNFVLKIKWLFILHPSFPWYRVIIPADCYFSKFYSVGANFFDRNLFIIL